MEVSAETVRAVKEVRAVDLAGVQVEEEVQAEASEEEDNLLLHAQEGE